MLKFHVLCFALFLVLPTHAEESNTIATAAPSAKPEFIAREFMLTFDDGPLPGKTDKVLATLRELKNIHHQPVKAAFFMVGDTPDIFIVARAFHAPYEIWPDKGSMRVYPEIVAAVRQDGHYIGNHTHHHSWFYWPWLRSQEAIKTELTEWEDIAGHPSTQSKLFRPPYLINTTASTAAAAEQGYQTILGTTIGDASPTNTLDDIKQNILMILANAPANGDPVVLIFHDTIAITYNNLQEIVLYLQQQGHQLVDFDPSRLRTTQTNTPADLHH